MTKKLLCVGGARPNFMKLAPLVRELGNRPRFQPLLVHTGQHYDDRMSGAFFRDLGMPDPAHFLEVGSGSHAVQTAEIMKRIEPVCESERPAAVIVVGDVNSTVAAALVAAKMGIPVVHVEAGLRSFDRGMPEEINRLVTDSISDLLLVTEESGKRNLLKEGAPESRVVVVGNLMIDSLVANLEQARARPALTDATGKYGVVTLHRPANVDSPEQFSAILQALDEISQTLPIYFPVHPRTRARLSGTLSPGIRLLEPLGYLDFLSLMSRASVVLTDSGGIQEETTALGIPCLTLRENTERPITIDEGTNRLAGTSTEGILAAWKEHLREPKVGRIPAFWDGRAASRCADALESFLFT
ncbi:MAG: UDP-N-acetylglucosamine 2-epimerase (non-hydrolyzing) [Acidobacteria bacterium]|nr:UDP-N-acetylglucosamine 2-epimerase (non-hydrolyzing) [Acidobacteriota bacterium]